MRHPMWALWNMLRRDLDGERASPHLPERAVLEASAAAHDTEVLR